MVNAWSLQTLVDKEDDVTWWQREDTVSEDTTGDMWPARLAGLLRESAVLHYTESMRVEHEGLSIKMQDLVQYIHILTYKYETGTNSLAALKISSTC